MTWLPLYTPLALTGGLLVIVESAGARPGFRKHIDRRVLAMITTLGAVVGWLLDWAQPASLPVATLMPLGLLVIQAWHRPQQSGYSQALACTATGLMVAMGLHSDSPGLLVSFLVVGIAAAGPPQDDLEAEAALKLWWWAAVGLVLWGLARLFVHLGSPLGPLAAVVVAAWWLAPFPVHGLMTDAAQGLRQPMLVPGLLWGALHMPLPALPISAAMVAWACVGVMMMGLLAVDAVRISKATSLLGLSILPLAMAIPTEANRAMVVWGLAAAILGGQAFGRQATWESVSGLGRLAPRSMAIALLPLAAIAGLPWLPWFSLRAEAATAVAALPNIASPAWWGLAAWASSLVGMFTVVRLLVFVFGKEPRSREPPQASHGLLLWIVIGMAGWSIHSWPKLLPTIAP